MRVVTEKGTADRVRSRWFSLTVVLCRSSANDLDLQMRRGRQSQPSEPWRGSTGLLDGGISTRRYMR
jgi:hypothetical protein